MRSIGKGLKALGAAIGVAIAKAYGAVLGLDDGQQRALMTWGLLGGIAALTLLLYWLLGRVDAHFPPNAESALAVAIVEGLLDLARWIIGIAALLCSGAVLIARGGTMAVKVSKDGVSLEATGSGQAAKELSKVDLMGASK